LHSRFSCIAKPMGWHGATSAGASP
jgi:hypothetical protein